MNNKFQEVERTGKWWELWPNEVTEAAKDLGYSDQEYNAALAELRKIYPADWVGGNYPKHPLLSSMFHSDGTRPIMEFLQIWRKELLFLLRKS